MPRLRRFPDVPAPPRQHSSPDEFVVAVVDVTKGARLVRRGDRLLRDDPMVVDRPDLFEVKYLLTQEVLD